MTRTRMDIERKLRRMTTAAPIRIGHLAIHLGRAQQYGYYLVTNGARQHYFYYYLLEPPESGHRADILDAYPDALESAVDYVMSHWRKNEDVDQRLCVECHQPFESPHKSQVFCSAHCRNNYNCRMYNRRKKAQSA